MQNRSVYSKTTIISLRNIHGLLARFSYLIQRNKFSIFGGLKGKGCS